MPERRMTRAESVIFISGWATTRSVVITLKMGSLSSASRRSRALTNPSTRRPSQTGKPLWASLSAIRRATSSTVWSPDTVTTSRVM